MPERGLNWAQDLGSSIPEVPVEWLLANVLPQLNYDHDATKRQLVAKKHITKRERWTGFTKDPKDSSSNEAKTFKHLESVIRNIIKYAVIPQKQCSNPLTYHDNLNCAPHSHRSNRTRPDGYFAREPDTSLSGIVVESKSTAHLHSWDDIALSAKYKKGISDEDRDDNTERVLWSMHHVMRSDPCRRFTFGITVENTQMRIWFASRSRVFVAKPFDFIRSYDTLIRFVVLFAHAGVMDLGWDPTTRRVSIDGSVQYKITVHDVSEGEYVERVFLTTRVLVDFGAEALRGRGTRVFEVRQVVKGTPGVGIFALKDVWTDFDRDREGQIFQRLKSDAGGDWVELEKYLLTVLYHGDVLINSRTDHTLDLILRGHDVPMSSRFKLKLKEPVTNIRNSSIGAPPTDLRLVRAPHTNASYQHKAHYRLVYEEVAEPVHSITKLADFFQALGDATTGLELMHMHDWVHRDISSGNILLYQGRGKLSDLEYAKRMSAQSSHEVRTGTIDFMSVEAEARELLFWKRPKQVAKRPPFRYNPLHDLESLWWVGIWMMMHHRAHPTEQGDDMHAAAKIQRDCATTFPGILGVASRGYALLIDSTLEGRFESQSPTCQPVALQLELVRKELVNHYRTAEDGLEINTAAFKGIHKTFIDALRDAKSESTDIQLRSLADILRETEQQLQDNDGDGAPGELAEEQKKKKKKKGKRRMTEVQGEGGEPSELAEGSKSKPQKTEV